jgi:hypothetical protein
LISGKAGEAGVVLRQSRELRKAPSPFTEPVLSITLEMPLNPTEGNSMQISLSAKNDRLVLELSDAKQGTFSIRMDRYEAFALIVSIAEVVNKLPTDPTVPLHKQQPALKAKYPSFQVGILDDDVVLAIQPSPLPLLEFQFEREGLTKLIRDLQKASAIPNHPSSKH